MPRGYRGFIATVVGVLIGAGLIWAYLRPTYPIIPSSEYQKAEDGKYSPGSPACYPSRLNSLPKGERADERYRCEQGAEEHRLKNDDLVQQTRAAEAAEAIVRLTYNQSLMMLAGTIFGLLTLVAAFAAVLYAKRASDAAKDQLTHALHTTRPYLTPLKERIVLNPQKPNELEVWLEFRNTGNTPAHQLVFFAATHFHHVAGKDLILHPGKWAHGTLGPQQPIDLEYRIRLAPSEMQSLRAGAGEATIALVGNYSNSFGEDWVYEAQLVINGQSLTTLLVYTKEARQYRVGDKKAEEASHQPTLDLKGGG